MFEQAIIGLLAFFFSIYSTSAKEIVPIWGQCGGISYCNYNMTLRDSPWDGHECALDTQCQSVNQYYWQCMPIIPSNSPDMCSILPSQQSAIIPPKYTADGNYNYAHVLNLSFMFYEAQRVGRLPKNNRIPWRRDAFVNDKAPNGKDISGGWLDAGDNMRFNLPLAWSAGTIAWSMNMFKDTYKNARLFDTAYLNLKWVSDYFIKCYYDEERIVAQIGNAHTDHARWTRPEYISEMYPVYTLSPQKPGSDLAGSVAGFLALMSTLSNDRNYSNKLLETAKKYYMFGNKYRGKYSVSVPEASGFYPSTNYYDDLAWAAICLHHVTKNPIYLQHARQHMQDHWVKEGTVWKNYDWDSHSWAAKVLLLKYAPDITRARLEVDEFVKTWLDSKGDGYNGPKYTPKGLAWYSSWGALRHTANAAFLMLAHDTLNLQDLGRHKDIHCFAHKQIRYILGASGRSYVVGYGNNPPMRPHHRASSCPYIPALCDWTVFDSKQPNPGVLYGALVGGPNIKDEYSDNRGDFITNEVAVDYNAGFTGALAGLLMNKQPFAQACSGV